MTALTDLSDIDIRRVAYSAECAANIAGVCRRCFSDPWSGSAVEGTLKAEQNFVVAADNGKLGFAAASLAFDTADILDVAVIPEMRGRGIARKMLDALLALLRDNGAESVFLEVRVSNAPAIGLYTSLGFKECGIRKNYYTSPREDAALYVLSLNGSVK